MLQTEPSAGPDWSELERSALTETGNILGCAYVNAITRLIDQPVGALSAVLRAGLRGERARTGVGWPRPPRRDTVLICRTCFHHEDDELNWRLLFVPTVALRMAMEDAIHMRPEPETILHTSG